MTTMINKQASSPSLWHRVSQTGLALAAALAVSPYDVLRNIAPYAGLTLAGIVGAGLLLGLVNLIAGRSADASQFWMRVRVVGQFAIICVLMAMLYVSQTV